MSRSVSTAFTTTKNAQTNEPRWLYEIETDGGVSLFLTNSVEDDNEYGIEYAGQLYRGIPAGDAPGGAIWHDDLSENINGQMDGARLSVGNSDQLMQAFLEDQDGLRGKYVIITMIFADGLVDATSRISWAFTINASGSQGSTVMFELVWRNDPLGRQVPIGLFDKETFSNAPAPNEVII